MGDFEVVVSPFGNAVVDLGDGKVRLVTLNDTGIDPRGHRILVKLDVVEQRSKGGIVVVTDDKVNQEEMAKIEGTVIAMGPECYADKKTRWCEIGDHIVFAKYAGLIPRKGQPYRLINDEDVVALSPVPVNKE